MDNHLGTLLQKAIGYLEQHPSVDAVYDEPVTASQESLAATLRIRSLDREETLLRERFEQLVATRRQFASTQPSYDQLPGELVVNFAI